MKPKVWWIAKGESNFCSELVPSEDNPELMVKSKPDGFYDIVSETDTVEGGIPVVEKAAYDKAVAALKRIANEDFRGNRPEASVVAFNTLKALGEL